MAKCFADVNGECSALKIKSCKGCTFYKSKEDAKRGRKKVFLRILALDEDIKDYIIDKYYDGEMEM